MARKSVPIEKYVDDLRTVLIGAMIHFDVYWVYKQRRDRKKFAGVLNEYLAFFQVSIPAHFIALVMALHQFYDTYPDTVNINELVSRLKSRGTTEPRTLAGIRRRLASAQPIWKKIVVLRNNIYAHRNAGLAPSDFFKRANLTPNQIRGLLRKSRNLLNAITLEIDGTTHAFNVRATSDTRRMLADLKGLKSLP